MPEEQGKPKSTIIQEAGVRPYKSPQQKKQFRILLGVIALVSVLGLAAYFLIIPQKETYTLQDYETAFVTRADLDQTTQASGEIAIPVQMTIANQDEAYAKRLFVKEGDAVKEGQILAELNASSLQEDLEDTEMSLADAKSNLEKTATQNVYTLKKAERDLVLLTEEIKEAAAEVEKLKELVKINAARQSEGEAAEKSLIKLQQQLENDTESLAETKELQQIDIALRKSNIKQLETKQARVISKIKALTVKSPMQGDVLSFADALAVPGSLIPAGKELFTIADQSSAIVELEVLEDYAGRLSVGQEIALTISGQYLTGKIASIGKIAQMTSDGLGATVQAKVKPILTGGESLLLGASAVGTISLGKKEKTLLLPRGPFLTTGSQKYLYVVENNAAQHAAAVRVEVTFGTIEGNNVEVLAGVNEGDLIITSGYQNFIQYSTIVLRKGE